MQRLRALRYRPGKAGFDVRENDRVSLLLPKGEGNQYLAVPPHVARHLPEKLQSLIGYSLGGYALGYYGDIQNPKEALKEVTAKEV